MSTIPSRPHLALSSIFSFGPISGPKTVFSPQRPVPYAFYRTDSRILSLLCLPFHHAGTGVQSSVGSRRRKPQNAQSRAHARESGCPIFAVLIADLCKQDIWHAERVLYGHGLQCLSNIAGPCCGRWCRGLIAIKGCQHAV
jgi:hypothetical protein